MPGTPPEPRASDERWIAVPPPAAERPNGNRFMVRRSDRNSASQSGPNDADGMVSFDRRATDQPLLAESPLPPSAVGDPEVTDFEPPRSSRRRVAVVVMVIGLLVVGGAFLWDQVLRSTSPPRATPADVARASAVNVHVLDLPPGWGPNAPALTLPAPASLAHRLHAVGVLAACVGQPQSSVAGWFGLGAFPGQITSVRSPTFGNETVPMVQLSSTTTLMAPPDGNASLEAALSTPKFATCLGQYEVAALPTPATAQVQSVALAAPPGVNAYGFVTLFTLEVNGTVTVGDTFLVAPTAVTLLQIETDGPAIPPQDFAAVFRSVSRRLAALQG